MRTVSALSMLLAACPVAALAQDGDARGVAPDERSAFDDTLEQAGRERYQQLENTPAARQAVDGYGRCAAKRQPGEADRLLTMDFKSARYRNGLRLLAQDAQRHCASEILRPGGAMRSADLLFSGALAEALLEAEAAPLNARLARGATSETPAFSSTDAIALCLARSLPDQVAALFGTEPGSEAETAAAAPLVQAVPACASASGVAESYELTVPAVRAMIATAAYRLLANSGDAHAQG